MNRPPTAIRRPNGSAPPGGDGRRLRRRLQKLPSRRLTWAPRGECASARTGRSAPPRCEARSTAGANGSAGPEDDRINCPSSATHHPPSAMNQPPSAANRP
eukprot:3048705-Pyramimonas_sp.AAC.1